jgi:phospholipid/cholesterol/gamma-HCH transport system substrate-binding protein
MNNQLKLGIFTIVGLLAIIVSIFASGAFRLSLRTYNIYSMFSNVAGLACKSRVKVAGVDVGVLKEISLNNSKAELKFSIDKKVILYKNSYARIVSTGIIGTKYIEIIPGNATFPMLKNGDHIPSGQNISLEDTLTNVINKINKALDNKKNINMLKNVSDAVSSLKKVLDIFEQHAKELPSIVKNFDEFSGNLVDISSQNKQDLRDVIKSIKETSMKINTLITRIYDGNGTISTLINDDEVSKDLKETVAYGREVVDYFKNTVRKVSKLNLSWNYEGRYDIKNSKYKNDVGISIEPSNRKFYYIGISNVYDSHHHNVVNDEETENINTFDALLGFRAKRSEIYGGLIRSKAGLGFGYSFLNSICDPCIKLKFHLNAYDFGRSKHGARINSGMMIGMTKWFSVGIAVEDISKKVKLVPYLKVKIDDKDLASLFGIINVAAVASK